MAKPLNRLISMTAGIGDPLVSAYANCYICRVSSAILNMTFCSDFVVSSCDRLFAQVGVSIDPSIREYQMLSLNNLLVVFKQVSCHCDWYRLLENGGTLLIAFLFYLRFQTRASRDCCPTRRSTTKPTWSSIVRRLIGFCNVLLTIDPRKI